MNRSAILLVLAAILVATDEWNPPAAPVADAVAIARVTGPPTPCGFGSESDLERRLTALRWNHPDGRVYDFQEADRGAWRALYDDPKADTGAHLVAASFLADRDAEVQAWIDRLARDPAWHLRHQAAEVACDVLRNKGPGADWAAQRLITMLDDSLLDSDDDDDPARFSDSRDRTHRTLGWAGRREAVPCLRRQLTRDGDIRGAIDALGELGDPAAAPDLIAIAKGPGHYRREACIALGQMRHRPAAPVVAQCLAEIGDQWVAEALARLAEPGAAAQLEAWGRLSPECGRIARRLVVQLREQDPVPGLLALLASETYEPERSDLIEALVRTRDRRAVAPLVELLEGSPSAFMRREAAFGLRAIGGREALLALCRLLTAEQPRDLVAEWGWKGQPEDWTAWFRGLARSQLQQIGGGTPDRDPAAWLRWAEAQPP